MKLRLNLLVVSALCLTGCANIGGGAPSIDAASALTVPLNSSFGAVGTAETAAAEDRRTRDREAQIRAHLADPAGAELAYADIQCSGYNLMRDHRRRGLVFGAAHESLEEVTGPSPETISGLSAALEQGPVMTASSTGTVNAQNALSVRNFFDQCNEDAQNADFAFRASLSSSRTESLSAATAILNFVDVFESIVKPVIVGGLTALDRRRRLEALNSWAADTSNGLPALENQLRVAANYQTMASGEARLVAAAQAREAWLVVVRARNELREDGRPIGRCEGEFRNAADSVNERGDIVFVRTQYRDSHCVLGITSALEDELTAFNVAASAYDTAFDANPADAYQTTLFAAQELRRWLRGELSPAEAAAVRAASIAAAEEWLRVISSAEKLTDDAETRNKLRDAADQLREALGLQSRRQTADEETDSGGD